MRAIGIRFVTAVAVVVLVAGVALAAEESPVPLPERFEAFVMAIGGPGPAATARIAITIERWTTPEERQTMLAALKEGGTDRLVEAMSKYTAGYLQVDNNLRWPLRSAATWRTEKGRMVRVATDRPLSFAEASGGFRSRDYPIGVAEFLIPTSGLGSGELLVATKIQFDKEGRLEVQSLPQNMAPQRMTNVKLIVPKEEKKKPAEKTEAVR